ncbi:hypothetical protein FB45DRAFT_841349 [Roridomyces roridus]|uniref:Transmembrane protein n=1 Tax=Roridomyces roridus TaxID=1738132 RepID=A0AAD7FF68_9AGAR|nr:hypothetical protein FB45DRAFT_841349 [Roridomyces roridus]
MNTDDGPQERGLSYVSEVTEPANVGPSALASLQAGLGRPDGARAAMDPHPRAEHLWPQSSKTKGKTATHKSGLGAAYEARYGHPNPADRDDSPRGRSSGPRNGRAYVSPHQPEAIVKSRPIAAVPRHSLRRMQDTRIADVAVLPRRRSSTPRVPAFHDANPPEQGYLPYPSPAPNPYFTPAPIVIIPPAPNEPRHISINPFSLQHATHDSRLPHTSSELPINFQDDTLPPPVTCSTGSRPCLHLSRILSILLLEVPRQLFLTLLLLRLPILYFHRVSRIFDDADLSETDIHRLKSANAEQWRDGTPGKLRTAWLPDEAIVAPHLQNFRYQWEALVDLLVREWTVLSLIEGLMLSAILTVLQIDAASKDPIARTSALLSLISTLIGLAFGSLYAVRFGTMRKICRAAMWADQAQDGRAWLVWNVWIMLAMPAVWFCWSIILFIICIVSFAWRTGVVSDSVLASSVLSHRAALGLRVGVSALLGVGFMYLLLALHTFRAFGVEVEQRRGEKTRQWMSPGDQQLEQQPHWSQNQAAEGRPASADARKPHDLVVAPRSRTPPVPRSPRRAPLPKLDVRPPVPVPTRGASFDRPLNLPPTQLSPFPAVKVGNLRYYFTDPAPLPSNAEERDIGPADWRSFIYDLENVWILTDSPPSSTPGLEPGDPVWVRERERVSGVIYLWNAQFFGPRSMEVVLCLEKPAHGGHPGLAVYLTHRRRPDLNPHSDSDDNGQAEFQVGALMESGLLAMTVIRLLEDASHGRYTAQYEVDFGASEGQGGHGEDGERMQSSGPGLAKSAPILAPSPVRAGHSALLANMRSRSDT